VSTPRFGSLRDGPSPAAPGGETFTDLAASGGARVERIASRAVADGAWYEQDWPEFVLLVEGGATLAFADGSTRVLRPGDWAFLPARCRHRVVRTDPERETLWLAVHLAGAEGAGEENLPRSGTHDVAAQRRGDPKPSLL
jgi:cupin 2 domain-containing protein